MLKTTLAFLAAVCCFIVTGAPAAFAEGGGLAGLHSQKRVGSKLCFSRHDHFGGGAGKTKRAARRGAIRSWRSFVIWEYGKAWGRYSRAASRSMKCSRTSKRSWECNAVARPCRRAKRARYAKRRRRGVRHR